MKVQINRPTQTEFGKLRTGQLFEVQGHIYIKGKGLSATAIHKNGGHMNAGEQEDMREDMIVQYVTELQVKVG